MLPVLGKKAVLEWCMKGLIGSSYVCPKCGKSMELRERMAQVAPELLRRMRTGIYLAVTAKRNRRSTASDLSRQLSSDTGTTVSRQTVYRRLGHIGLYARRPVRSVPLTATHCRLRLIWSREHALWTPQQWSCVTFSDESRTDLHVQSVTMTGHIYRDVILEQHVRLFRGTMDAEFLFMDDNARPHRANIVDECLQSEDITPRQPPPTCLPELRRSLLDEWCNTPQDQIDNLILSMPRRYKAPPIRLVSDTGYCAVGPGFKARRKHDVCKCTVPSRQGGTLNSRRVASPLVRLVKGEAMWEALDYSQGVLPQNWGGAEQNHAVTCMVLKATTNDRRTSSPLP
ncbi:transposable element Tcb1 transposase [Trichonephila clavipes]|nr:transposable element Tcb1 transposase [Trichonephila clavipes]